MSSVMNRELVLTRVRKYPAETLALPSMLQPSPFSMTVLKVPKLFRVLDTLFIW